MNLIHTLPGPLILAHRGASAHAPENTLAAFRLGLEHGADGVELDAKLTADGHIVVIHDQSVDRTTNGHGKVQEMTLAQLKDLDAGSSFDPRYAGEPVPTLGEVFTEIGNRALINVEITNYATPTDELADKIADLVIEYGLQEHVIFSSFFMSNLRIVRRRLPQVPVAILTLKGMKGWLYRGWVGRISSPELLHPYFTDVTLNSLSHEHRLGRKVNAWTVNDENEMRRLYKIGIDGIITDDPMLARRVLEER